MRILFHKTIVSIVIDINPCNNIPKMINYYDRFSLSKKLFDFISSELKFIKISNYLPEVYTISMFEVYLSKIY